MLRIARREGETIAGPDVALTLSTVNAMDRAQFTAALGAVTERAPSIIERAWDERPFASVAALQAAIQRVIERLPRAAQLDFLRAHPELAGKALRDGDVTVASRGEQGGAGLDRLTEDEYACFDRLNRAYREKFGFPFIVAVRNHDKASILAAYERRLGNGADAEIAAALAEIGTIIGFRLAATFAVRAGEGQP
jgi:OHCU decarboxylase